MNIVNDITLQRGATVDTKMLDRLAMISLADKTSNEYESWMFRTPCNFSDTSERLPMNILRNYFHQNTTKSFYGDSIGSRLSLSQRSNLRNRLSTGSENLSSNSKISLPSNEKSQSKLHKL